MIADNKYNTDLWIEVSVWYSYYTNLSFTQFHDSVSLAQYSLFARSFFFLRYFP